MAYKLGRNFGNVLASLSIASVAVLGCTSDDAADGVANDDTTTGDTSGGSVSVTLTSTTADPTTTTTGTGEADTTEGSSDGSESGTGSETGADSTTGTDTSAIGCQVEMAPEAVHAYRAASSDRMPSLGEVIGVRHWMGSSSPTVPTGALGGTPPPQPGGIGFIMDPDGGGTTIECDVFAQDCPLGEKCMAWANDGASSWNATRCTEVDPNPAAIGDACTVVGSGVSGIDSCDIGVMCWDVDVETNTGTCVEMCSGSARNPVCNTPQTACSISNEGVLILCLPICNPLAGECGEGQGCYDTGDVFQCAPDASGGDTTTGDPCEFLNACSDGYACVNPAVVPDCVGSVGCCTAYCTIDDESPCVDGQTCIPYYEAGTAPDACLEDVGICSAG